jgi:transcriptional regulator with XRE-family HTH domain
MADQSVATRDDQVGDAVALVTRIVEEHPGLSPAAVAARLTGKNARRRSAIAAAIASGRVQEGVTYLPSRGGSRRSAKGLFPASRPAAEDVAPLSPAELISGRRSAGVNQTELAERLGVSRALVVHWEQGRQPIPAGRAAELRFFLTDRGWIDELRREAEQRDERLVYDFVAFIDEKPGQPGHVIVAMAKGDVRRRWVALKRAEQAGLVHRRLTVVPDVRDGRRRRLGYYRGPGPSPLSTPADWVPFVVAAVELEPGITRTAVRAQVGYSGAVLRAITEAITAGRIHEQACRRAGGGHFAGLFPGPSASASSLSGKELRRRRVAAGATKWELSQRVGVNPVTLARWEQRRPPAYMASTLEQALREAAAAPRRDPAAEMLPLVLRSIEHRPGVTRQDLHREWGSAKAIAAAVERALEQGLVHEDVTGWQRPRRRLYPGPALDRSGWTHEVRSRRHRSGLTQAELGRRVGVSGSEVAGWEKGDRLVPEYRMMRLRRVLDEATAALRSAILDTIEANPGISREALTRGRAGGVGLGRGVAVQAMLEELLEQGAAHLGSALVENAIGRTKAGVGFFIGPEKPSSVRPVEALERAGWYGGCGRFGHRFPVYRVTRLQGGDLGGQKRLAVVDRGPVEGPTLGASQLRSLAGLGDPRSAAPAAAHHPLSGHGPTFYALRRLPFFADLARCSRSASTTTPLLVRPDRAASSLTARWSSTGRWKVARSWSSSHVGPSFLGRPGRRGGEPPAPLERAGWSP